VIAEARTGIVRDWVSEVWTSKRVDKDVMEVVPVSAIEEDEQDQGGSEEEGESDEDGGEQRELLLLLMVMILLVVDGLVNGEEDGPEIDEWVPPEEGLVCSGSSAEDGCADE